jgi:hypothetical protein
MWETSGRVGREMGAARGSAPPPDDYTKAGTRALAGLFGRRRMRIKRRRCASQELTGMTQSSTAIVIISAALVRL